MTFSKRINKQRGDRTVAEEKQLANEEEKITTEAAQNTDAKEDTKEAAKEKTEETAEKKIFSKKKDKKTEKLAEKCKCFC